MWKAINGEMFARRCAVLDQNVSSQLLAKQPIKPEYRDMSAVAFILPASKSIDGVKV